MIEPSRRSNTDTLPLTGERTVPGVATENYWFRRHEAAYAFAEPLVARRRVLEVGCGEGYETAALAGSASGIVGIDYDALTVAHASGTYPQASFVRANLAALPIRSIPYPRVHRRRARRPARAVRLPDQRRVRPARRGPAVPAGRAPRGLVRQRPAELCARTVDRAASLRRRLGRDRGLRHPGCAGARRGRVARSPRRR
jgi:hypothetical protein